MHDPAYPTGVDMTPYIGDYREPEEEKIDWEDRLDEDPPEDENDMNEFGHREGCACHGCHHYYSKV